MSLACEAFTMAHAELAAQPEPWLAVFARIKRDVAARHGITVSDLEGEGRRQVFTVARHEAFYLLRLETKPNGETRFSLPRIGQQFGGRDHSTVHHGIRQHERRMLEGAE